MGSVDGNRIWGKELPKVILHHVEWSPDGGRYSNTIFDFAYIYLALGKYYFVQIMAKFIFMIALETSL